MNTKKEQIFIGNAKPRFNLRSPKGERPTSIFLVINLDKQYKIPLGVKVIPNHWNKKNYRALVSASLSELDNQNNSLINAKVLDYSNKFSSFISYLCNHVDEISNPTSAIQSVFGMNKQVKKVKLSALLSTALRKKNMTESSFKIYNGILNEFTNWIDTVHPTLSIDGLTFKIFQDYKDYLFDQKIVHKVSGEKVAPENNTVMNKLKVIITIIGYTDGTEELCAKLKRISKEIKLFNQSENQIFINDEEIERLFHLELDGEEEIARDVFLFQLSSGQRFSDIEKLFGVNLSNYIEDGMITIVQKKTKAKVTFPIDDYAKAILEKYDYILPSTTNTKVNKSIKQSCKKAEINEICHCVELRGGDTYEYDTPKYELIGTHTARRSFISNAIKDGIDTQIIKKVSGHKSDAFDKYNRLNSKDAVKSLIKHRKGSGNTSTIVPNGDGGATVHSADTNALENEIKHVLMMFGVPAVDWFDLNDVEELYRLLIQNETLICQKAKIEYKVLKDLFNDPNLGMKEKVELIKNL